MLIQPTLTQLRELKLTGMAQAFEQQLEQPATHALAFEERFGLLVQNERTWRDNRRLQRLLQQARFKQAACLEDLDYRTRRGLDRTLIARLASGDWLRQHFNIHLTGATGTGKSWVASALGQQACRLGFSVRYERTNRLLEELSLARGDGTLAKKMAALAKTDLLIVDDFGLKPLTTNEKHDLLELIEDRHGARSTMLTSQLPVALWHEYLASPTLADALLDRLLHQCYKIELEGESLRKKNAQA